MKEGEIILLPVHFSYTTNDNGKLNNNPIENGKSKILKTKIPSPQITEFIVIISFCLPVK